MGIRPVVRILLGGHIEGLGADGTRRIRRLDQAPGVGDRVRATGPEKDQRGEADPAGSFPSPAKVSILETTRRTHPLHLPLCQSIDRKDEE